MSAPLNPGPRPFDRWIEGDESAISNPAKRGFVLFNTKATCFACHTGWRFTDDKFHDIGVSKKDHGRGAVLKDDETAQYAFKTPTLRSVALRPPYMHDGSTATLLDAVKHYEKEPIDRPSRSPLFVPTALSEQERNDLVAFMQTLTGFPGRRVGARTARRREVRDPMQSGFAFPALTDLAVVIAKPLAKFARLSHPGLRECDRVARAHPVCDRAQPWLSGERSPLNSPPRGTALIQRRRFVDGRRMGRTRCCRGNRRERGLRGHASRSQPR